MDTSEGLACWLARDYAGAQWPQQAAWQGQDIKTHPVLATLPSLENKRLTFTINALLAIDGSLLIRSGFEQDQAPDVSQLASWRDGKWQPVLAGTSLAGVLRHQA